MNEIGKIGDQLTTKKDIEAYVTILIDYKGKQFGKRIKLDKKAEKEILLDQIVNIALLFKNILGNKVGDFYNHIMQDPEASKKYLKNIENRFK